MSKVSLIKRTCAENLNCVYNNAASHNQHWVWTNLSSNPFLLTTFSVILSKNQRLTFWPLFILLLLLEITRSNQFMGGSALLGYLLLKQQRPGILANFLIALVSDFTCLDKFKSRLTEAWIKFELTWVTILTCQQWRDIFISASAKLKDLLFILFIKLRLLLV